GHLRGGDYSEFYGGTRVPFIISWPETILTEIFDALVSQIDLLASFSLFLNVPITIGEALDSETILSAFVGKSNKARDIIIKQGGALSITKGNWKYIAPNKGAMIAKLTGIELGNSSVDQLYNLKDDVGEQKNLADKNPKKVKK